MTRAYNQTDLDIEYRGRKNNNKKMVERDSIKGILKIIQIQCKKDDTSGIQY